MVDIDDEEPVRLGNAQHLAGIHGKRIEDAMDKIRALIKSLDIDDMHADFVVGACCKFKVDGQTIVTAGFVYPKDVLNQVFMCSALDAVAGARVKANDVDQIEVMRHYTNGLLRGKEQAKAVIAAGM